MLGREIRAINYIQKQKKFEKYGSSYNNISEVV